MTPRQLLHTIAQAEEVMEHLALEKENVQEFRQNLAKKIKCVFCEHKGRSLVETEQPWASYLISAVLIYLISYGSLLLIPFVFGILIRQIHRCPKCLNQIREESIFESLEDTILEVNLCQFGLLLKRRTLVKGLILIVSLLSFVYLYLGGS